MPKKHTLFEATLEMLGNLTTSDTERHIDSLALAHVRVIESIIVRAKLTLAERVRADAALYQAFKVLAQHQNQHNVQHNIWGDTEAMELPIPGYSTADKKLQEVIQGFAQRRAAATASTAQEA